MGFWTYTYANINKKAATAESMGYDGRKPVILALPDNTFLTEKYYDGYGIIAGHDVLELVVDWNMETYEALAVIDKHIADDYTERSRLILDNDPERTFRINYLTQEIPVYQAMREYLAGNASLPSKIEKRQVGIALATYDWEQEMIRYPIKFVKNKKHTYDKIKGYSSNTQ